MRFRTYALFVILTCAAATATAATVDGIPLHSSSSGSGAKTLILVHGWTCDETSWKDNVPELSKHYRVITLDLPGHGKSGSTKDGTLTMDLFARAVEAVRAEAKADKVILVGHSMGTPVIRQYARLYPQHVSALVAVDGVLALGTSARRGGPPPPQADRMRGPDGLKNREAMIRTMFTPATPQPLQRHVLEMMLAAPEATAYSAMTATFDPAIWKDDVMTMPVLGIYADKSALADQGYTKKIFPSFEYHEIPGTGHFVMMEKPKEFDQLLIGFVDKIK
ncbi:MAG TPA: alpha/beta hydrolase [Vicinamibacterales bacterium]|jgi:pimeloyl-ACP methyl ester carboxylesterase